MKDSQLWRFFGISMGHYLAQNLFFIAIAGYLSSLANPLMTIGNLLLVAMVPFFLVGFFLAPLIDKVPTKRQILGLKALRLGVLTALGFGLVQGFSALPLIYGSVLVFDLAFYLFQTTSAKMSKELAARSSVKHIEALGLLAMQFGMISGGLAASALVSWMPLGTIFLIAGLIEGASFLLALWYKAAPTESGATFVVQSQGKSLLKSLQLVGRNPSLAFFVLAFALILPTLQVMNLIGGPWVETQFHDAGKTLGWISAGMAFGACACSLVLLRFKTLRESKALLFAPLIVTLAVGALAYVTHQIPLVAVAVVLGIGFAAARVAARSTLIEAAPANAVSELTTLGLMGGIVISIVLVLVLRQGGGFVIGFYALLGIALVQFLGLVCGQYWKSRRSDVPGVAPAA